MNNVKRLAVCAAAVTAVVALTVDWDPDEPARRSDMSRHPSAKPQPVLRGCSCTLCRARYGGIPLVMTAPSPAALAAISRPGRIQLGDEEVFRRFFDIVLYDATTDKGDK